MSSARAESYFPDALMFAHHVVPAAHVSMPDVCCDLYWIGERVMVAGPQTRAMASRYVGRDIQLLNIDPMLARAWLGVPLHELTDRAVPLSDLHADGPLAELFYRQGARRLVRPPSPPPACDARAARAEAMMRAGRAVSETAAAVELSERQLERLFQDWFGLAPKQYANILRLRRAVAKARGGASLAAAAHAAGYADQSHFSRHVRALSGASPRTLLPHVGNVQDTVTTRAY